MKFTDEQLNSFIALYKQEFGEKINHAEAQKQAIALISLVKLTYKPMSRKDLEECMEILEKDINCDII